MELPTHDHEAGVTTAPEPPEPLRVVAEWVRAGQLLKGRDWPSGCGHRSHAAAINAWRNPLNCIIVGGMAHDPNAEFDHTVLDMIERSTVGAVPHTPAYDDAIKRLSAAQQVYPDADHKDGYVTARSLARLPWFRAANWEEFAAGRIAGESLEPNASVFARYAALLPEALRPRAENFRGRVAGKPVVHRPHGGAVFHDPIHSLFLVPGSGPNRGLPGNYLHGLVNQLSADPTNGAWAVDVHDGDDGVVLFDAPNLAAAAEKLQEVIESAPFHLWELEGLGFRRK